VILIKLVKLDSEQTCKTNRNITSQSGCIWHRSIHFIQEIRNCRIFQYVWRIILVCGNTLAIFTWNCGKTFPFILKCGSCSLYQQFSNCLCVRSC